MLNSFCFVTFILQEFMVIRSQQVVSMTGSYIKDNSLMRFLEK